MFGQDTSFFLDFFYLPIDFSSGELIDNNIGVNDVINTTILYKDGTDVFNAYERYVDLARMSDEVPLNREDYYMWYLESLSHTADHNNAQEYAQRILSGHPDAAREFRRNFSHHMHSGREEWYREVHRMINEATNNNNNNNNNNNSNG